jgi:hypothetical protein
MILSRNMIFLKKSSSKQDTPLHLQFGKEVVLDKVLVKH